MSEHLPQIRIIKDESTVEEEIPNCCCLENCDDGLPDIGYNKSFMDGSADLLSPISVINSQTTQTQKNYLIEKMNNILLSYRNHHINPASKDFEKHLNNKMMIKYEYTSKREMKYAIYQSQKMSMDHQCNRQIRREYESFIPVREVDCDSIEVQFKLLEVRKDLGAWPGTDSKIAETGYISNLNKRKE